MSREAEMVAAEALEAESGSPTQGEGSPETGGEAPIDVGLKALEELGDPPTEPKTPAEGDEATDGEAAEADEETDTEGAEASEPEPEAEPETAGEPQDKPDKSNWLSSEEFKALPRKAQDRIRGLDRERKTLREQVEALQPQAESLTQLSDFCREHDLSNDDFTKLMTFGAAMKAGEFSQAWEILQPYVETLQVAVGQTLPGDLREAVDNGDMTEDAAKRVAQQRAEAQKAEIRATRAETRQQEFETQRQQQQRLEAIRGKVQETVAKLEADDKGFGEIRQDVVAEIQRLRKLGVPVESEAQAEKIVREAYDTVRARVRPKPSTMPRPGSSSRPARTTRQRDPNQVSDLEVAMEALNEVSGL